MLRETKVKNGRLRGLPGNDPRVTVYKGVPFAAPPTGRNRWRAPQPCEDWEGVREAYTFGPISVQDRYSEEASSGDIRRRWSLTENALQDEAWSW